MRRKMHIIDSNSIHDVSLHESAGYVGCIIGIIGHRVDLYYGVVRKECPVKRSGRAMAMLRGKIDKALDEKRTHNNNDEDERKLFKEVEEKVEGITVQASWKQKGKANRQEE